MNSAYLSFGLFTVSHGGGSSHEKSDDVPNMSACSHKKHQILNTVNKMKTLLTYKSLQNDWKLSNDLRSK